MKTILFVLLVSIPALANVGFKNGNNFEIIELRGTVTVNCSGEIGSRMYSCFDEIVSPGFTDVLTGDVNADHVFLTATHESGKSHSKDVKFDASKKESGKINLLISTVFQRPLLDYGKNVVKYNFTSQSKEVLTGEFESNVKIVEQRQCPWISIWESGIGCTNQTSACNEYFRRLNDCK